MESHPRVCHIEGGLLRDLDSGQDNHRGLDPICVSRPLSESWCDFSIPELGPVIDYQGRSVATLRVRAAFVA